jgi:hypothetical protein
MLAAEGLTGSLQELCLVLHNDSAANGDAVVAAIACEPFPALRTLLMTQGRHTDASIASVARACWAPQLTYLYLISR